MVQKSRKETIKDCAARLFRKKGFSATTMNDIADAVGIKAASLYNHFNSKQDLLKDLLMYMAQRFTKGMAEIENASLPPIEKLERLIALHVRLTTDHTDAISIITGEWVHLKEPELSAYSTMREEYEGKFKRIIEACKKDGSIADVNTEIALFSMLSTLHWLYSWYSKNKNISPIDLEKQLIQVLLNGLKT